MKRNPQSDRAMATTMRAISTSATILPPLTYDCGISGFRRPS